MDHKPNVSFRGLNTGGLQDATSRLNMFEWLKGNHTDHPVNDIADINFLSEVHCRRPKQGKKWGEEWSLDDKNSLWSCGSGKKKGVAILIIMTNYVRNIRT